MIRSASLLLIVAAAPVAWAMVDAGGGGGGAPAGPAVDRVALARAHAPLYRFNAWVDGDGSPANKAEDYFPMSCRSYFDQLAARKARVVIHESHGTTRGTNAIKSISGDVEVRPDKIVGAPWHMAGDAPGAAPVYVHVYEDATRRVRRADGSGEDLWYVEYWLFYGQDASRAEVKHLGIDISLGGHRGDWEHVCLAVAVDRGVHGKIRGSEVRRGFYAGHYRRIEVDRSRMHFFDDRGDPDPRGGHPLVAIACGKHASYPEPGTWRKQENSLLEQRDEIFRANGCAWRAWTTPVWDLEGPDATEFSPPSLAKLASSDLRIRDWRAYRGQWGNGYDIHLPLFGTKHRGESPTGPRMKSDYGGKDKTTHRWSELLRTSVTLEHRRDVVPAPAPNRL